jgi:hypothetical protein
MRTPGYVASPAEVEAAQAVEAEIARRWAELATCSTERTS